MATAGTEPHPVPRKLWEHPDPSSTAMYKFMQEINEKYGLKTKVIHFISLISLHHDIVY